MRKYKIKHIFLSLRANQTLSHFSGRNSSFPIYCFTTIFHTVQQYHTGFFKVVLSAIMSLAI